MEGERKLGSMGTISIKKHPLNGKKASLIKRLEDGRVKVRLMEPHRLFKAGDEMVFEKDEWVRERT